MAASPRPVTLEGIGLKGEPNAYGFRIVSVAPGGAAATAGLVQDDYIVSVNCIKVRSADDLTTALSRSASPALVEINKPTWLPNRTEVHRLQIGQ